MHTHAKAGPVDSEGSCTSCLFLSTMRLEDRTRARRLGSQLLCPEHSPRPLSRFTLASIPSSYLHGSTRGQPGRRSPTSPTLTRQAAPPWPEQPNFPGSSFSAKAAGCRGSSGSSECTVSCSLGIFLPLVFECSRSSGPWSENASGPGVASFTEQLTSICQYCF